MASISRKKARKVTRSHRNAAGAGVAQLVDESPDLTSMEGVASKEADRLTDDENQLTGAWFTAYINGLDDAVIALEAAIPRAPASAQPALIAQRDDLVARSMDAMQQKNAFFQSKTISLRPPTQKVIDETMRLSRAIADRIASEKRAQAIVKLVNDLSGVLTKLRS